jgi:carbon-monoxide dehydrogenase medium subunit
MNLWRNYLTPASVPEALQALASSPRPAVPIAGGTDLLIDLEQGRHEAVQTLVDVTSIAEMTAIEVRGDSLFIGAAASLSRVAEHPLVGRYAQALLEACELIGGPQVRNVATLGGNVAHALPAADGTIALIALDSQVEIASVEGRRRRPLAELFVGPGKSVLNAGEELIVGFHIPAQDARCSSCFKRIMRPQGVALPILNLAVWLEREGPTIQDIRIAVGPGGPVPWRAHTAEQALAGTSMSEAAFKMALGALLSHVEFRSSPRRASAEYRCHLIAVLLKETLDLAWGRSLRKAD